MNTINALSGPIFQNHHNQAAREKDKEDSYKYKDMYSRQDHEGIVDRFNNYSKGISVPPAVLNKLNAAPQSMFEDVTYDEEHQHLQECGPYKLYRTYLDNGEGNGERAVYTIRLRTSSQDIKIDSGKLKNILNKALIIAKKMVPIYAKMNGTATLAGIDYELPFNEATQTVDFEAFVKHLIEGTNSLLTLSDLDDDAKAALQKMLKECEDFLLKSLDDDEEKTSKPEAAADCDIKIEYKNKIE